MKSKLNPVPAANRTQEKINDAKNGYVQLKPEEAQKLVTGIYELDAKVKLKDSQIATITKQKSDLQQLVTTKTSEVQSKNSLLSQKEQLLIQKEQLLSELRIKEENQLKEEYISVLHQLNPKVFSANYEDWGGKYQGYKDLIVNGDYKTIKKHIPIHKQKLAQKIETEKLALATKEAEKLDKAKEEAVSILHQLHPHSYPVNYEDWPTHIKARKLLDSGNLQAIEKNLVVYRELLKKELARQKEEVQNKDQLILQKEQDLKSLNDTFTTTILTKEEEIITKSQLLSQTTSKVKKVSRKLAQKNSELLSKEQLLLQQEMEKEELRIQKEQEIERLRELLNIKESETQEKDALLLAKELEKQELLIQKEREKEELLALKENELREKEELLLAKESEVHNKSAEKNRIIEELASNLLTKEEEIVSKNLKIGEVSHKAKKAGRKLAAKDNLLSDKEQKIEELKALIEQTRLEKEELLAQQELALANKSHMKNQIIDGLREEVELKKNEVIDLRIQNLEKELMTQEQEKLLIQKELELADKSFVKNQVIGDLQENIGLKEKEAYKLQIELLMKQVEFKDKALEDAHVINELQGKLLAFQNLSKHDETLQLELSVIHFKVEESILNGNLEEMKELSKYLSQLMNNPADKDESLDISELLNNLSPVVHSEQNQVQNPLAVINNFDINHINTTHSVLLGGEGSESFSIIDAENSH